ncbi:hypothetical protein HK405_013327 [Cladochytrium tenue]|nr:hypothetical protein HK405_013327 [Cladochytrium tenue]
MLREWTSAAPPRRPPKGSSAAEPQTTGGYGNIETAYPAVYQPHSGHAAPLADPYEERDISRGRLQAAYPATTASPHPSSSPAPPPPPKDAEDGDVTSGRRDVVGGVVAASPAPSSVLGPDAVGTVGLKPWVEGERPSSTASSAALSTGTDRPLLD